MFLCFHFLSDESGGIAVPTVTVFLTFGLVMFALSFRCSEEKELNLVSNRTEYMTCFFSI